MAVTLAILVKDQAGVLSRIANSFSRRGYNIASIAAGLTQDPDVTRITVKLDVDHDQVPLVIRQLYKQPDVLMVKELLKAESFARELMLVKVKADAGVRSEIVTIVDIFRAGIVDVSFGTVTIQITGVSSKLDAFIEMLRPYKLMELVRTGNIAISRGDSMLNVRMVDATVDLDALAAEDDEDD